MWIWRTSDRRFQTSEMRWSVRRGAFLVAKIRPKSSMVHCLWCEWCASNTQRKGRFGLADYGVFGLADYGVSRYRFAKVSVNKVTEFRNSFIVIK
jgi:hypothetical protein